MFDIARTEALRNTALQLLEQHERELASNPDSFANQLMVISSTSRVDELTQRLIEQKNNRQIEIIEIRLIGDEAQNGSLPMHMIGQLSSSFEETLVEIGKFAKHGSKKKKGGYLETRTQLGAKLKRIGAGSTRLFVSVDTNPDMFGGSLSEVCISRTFGILYSKNPDELIETSGVVGKPALRTINRFLKSLLDFKLEVDLSWYTPLDTELTWKGNKQAIQYLQSTLASIVECEPIEANYEGELVTQSLKGQGRFELVSQDGITIGGTVPYDVLAYFVQVRIGSYCRVKVIQTVIENPQTAKTKSFYELREIEVVNRSIDPKKAQLNLFNPSQITLAPPTLQDSIEIPRELADFRNSD